MARCPNCGNVVATGSQCLVAATDCFAISGVGSEASPHTIVADLDPAVTNLLTCGGSGLLAALPSTITNPPTAEAFNASNLSIPNNTLTAVTLNSEVFDTDTMHSTSSNTNRITFTTTGTYIVTFNATWNKNTTGIRLAEIRKNGTDVLAVESKRTGGSDLLVGHSIAVQDQFTAADYVEALVHQTSGAALLLLAESYSPFLAATKI